MWRFLTDMDIGDMVIHSFKYIQHQSKQLLST
jgi:hypothetical protein